MAFGAYHLGVIGVKTQHFECLAKGIGTRSWQTRANDGKVGNDGDLLIRLFVLLGHGQET